MAGVFWPSGNEAERRWLYGRSLSDRPVAPSVIVLLVVLTVTPPPCVFHCPTCPSGAGGSSGKSGCVPEVVMDFTCAYALRPVAPNARTRYVIVVFASTP